MGAVTDIITGLENTFRPSLRAGRGEFVWTGALLLFAYALIPEKPKRLWSKAVALLAAIFVFAAFYSLAVRRLHDVALPGWLLLLDVALICLFVAAALLARIVSTEGDTSLFEQFLAIAPILLAVLFFAAAVVTLMTLLQPSSPYHNEYGPSPIIYGPSPFR